MPEVLIQLKLKATNQLATARERIAYRMFAEGIADINPNAEIVGAKDEEEESEIRLTIRALVEQRSRIPHGKAFAHDEKQDTLDTEILSLFSEMVKKSKKELANMLIQSSQPCEKFLIFFPHGHEKVTSLIDSRVLKEVINELLSAD